MFELFLQTFLLCTCIVRLVGMSSFLANWHFYTLYSKEKLSVLALIISASNINEWPYTFMIFTVNKR
jgi:hypothetical protein